MLGDVINPDKGKDELEDEERQKLKEVRKERKKEKRKIKQLERHRKLEENKSLFEIKNQGGNISIVTSKFVEQKIFGVQNQINMQCMRMQNSDQDQESICLSNDEQFPLLSENVNVFRNHKRDLNKIYKQDFVKNQKVVNVNNVQKLSLKNRKTTTVSIGDLLNAAVKSKEKSSLVNEHKLIGIGQTEVAGCSNPLDSSQPKRMVGKHREIPKEKKPNKLKKEIREELERKEQTENEMPFRYHDNVINEELNNATSVLLKRIVEMQEKMFHKNPEKGKRKKRYVAGFHETKKFLIVKKIKLLIFAIDLQVTENGTLHNLIKDLITISKEKEIPYVFALKRKILGKLLLKTVPISCVGILNYEGADELFKNLMEMLCKYETKDCENRNTTQGEDVTALLANKMKEALFI